MIKALIFDMDGTLVDSETLHFEAWKETLLRHGVERFAFDDFISYVGVSNEKLAEDYIHSVSLSATIGQLVKEKQEIYLQMIPAIKPLAGVETIINRFSEDYRLAVASSSDCIEIENILKTLNLRHRFEYIVGGDMTYRKKPDPDIYLKVVNLLGLAPYECIAFEDSESGLVSAKDAGMFVVAVPNKLSEHHDFSRADLIVDCLDKVDGPTLAEFSVDVD